MNNIEQDTEIHDLWVYIREWNDKFGRLPKDEDELASCIDYVMKRQKSVWSKEDEITLNNILSCIKHCQNEDIEAQYNGNRYVDPKHYEPMIDWLKHLKPQKYWKPNEKQMEALNAINVIGEISYVGQGNLLIELYNELKKL